MFIEITAGHDPCLPPAQVKNAMHVTTQLVQVAVIRRTAAGFRPSAMIVREKAAGDATLGGRAGDRLLRATNRF
jgi:hypothetical protein